MCHEYTSRVWDRERADSEAEPASESGEELPEFANEDGSDDVEVLTDGGDDNDES